MQMVIIEYPVVYPFVRSAVTVGLLIFLRSPRDRGIESDVPVRLGVDTAVIGGGGTCFPAGAGSYFTAGKGTAPFTGMLLFTVPPVDHTVNGHTQGSTIFVNGDGLRDGFGPAAVHIKVNKRTDIPFLAEHVERMSKIKDLLVTVPVRIRIGEMAFAGAVHIAVF